MQKAKNGNSQIKQKKKPVKYILDTWRYSLLYEINFFQVNKKYFFEIFMYLLLFFLILEDFFHIMFMILCIFFNIII